ncbi:serine incorporator 1-like [Cetorhinus maximus]
MPVKVTVTLNFYAFSSFRRPTGDMCGISVSAIHHGIKEVTDAFIRMANQYILYRTDLESWVLVHKSDSLKRWLPTTVRNPRAEAEKTDNTSYPVTQATLGLLKMRFKIPCLCSSAPCLVCSCCPTGRTSIVTRLVYTTILLLGTTVAGIMLVPAVEDQLRKIPGFCEIGYNAQLPEVNPVICRVLVGYKSVYRICFGMATFFLLLALLMINVRNSKDPRALVHNGFWLFKFGALVAIMVGAFYIPEGHFSRVSFGIGSAGAFCFILTELVLLVDFGHSWNKSWLKRSEEGGSQCWYFALLSVTCLNYVLSLTMAILCYVFYTTVDGCIENKFVISFNILICVVASLISVHPKIQEFQLCTGLQSSIITLYIMCLTWSAMTNEPNDECNPNMMSFFERTFPSTDFDNKTVNTIKASDAGLRWDSQCIAGLALFLICILYLR